MRQEVSANFKFFQNFLIFCGLTGLYMHPIFTAKCAVTIFVKETFRQILGLFLAQSLAYGPDS